MPYYNKDPKRDHNFDNHLYIPIIMVRMFTPPLPLERQYAVLLFRVVHHPSVTQVWYKMRAGVGGSVVGGNASSILRA